MIKDLFVAPTQSDEESSMVVKTKISGKDIKGIFTPDQLHMPGRLHVGDVSSDGFNDLLITLEYTNGTSEAKLLLNTPCTEELCSKKATKARRRTFAMGKDAVGKFEQDLVALDDDKSYRDHADEYSTLLANYKHVQYAVFFDLMEDSLFDILMVHRNSENELKITAIFNNIDRQAFFLKAKMVSENSLVSSAVVGASFRCVLTSLSDEKFVVMAGSNG